MGVIYNVKDFGATGDGQTLDTSAFNAAVEKAALCSGTVFVPDGVYLLGSVRLKSNIRFEMTKNAVLRGSDLIEDFGKLPYDEENRYHTAEDGPYGCFFKHALLYAHEAENIEIVGGKILFDDLAYGTIQKLDPLILDEDSILGVGYFRQPSFYNHPKKERPVGLYLSKCRKIVVKGVCFEKSPAFSTWILKSESLAFEEVKIRNSKYQWNGDGLHFSSCKNVVIQNCDIDASDDCIAIDGNYGAESENFFVSNCVLRSTMHVIRLYTGLDFGTEETGDSDYRTRGVHHVTISDCEVLDGAGVLLVCAFDGDIWDVKLKNFTCRQKYEGTAISMSAKAGTVRDCTIKNADFHCNGIGYFCAENHGKIDGIALENCSFTVTPKTKFWGDDYPDGVATHTLSMPYGMVVKNTEKLTLKNCSVVWEKAEFSDSLPKELQEKMQNALGEQLQRIEPKNIRAITAIESNVVTENCKFADYEAES